MRRSSKKVSSKPRITDEVKNVYFFINNNYVSPEEANYQPPLITFAEGLKNLNIKFDSNQDYFKTKGEYLFKKKIISNIFDYNNYDLLINGYDTEIPKKLISLKNRKYSTISFDWSDGLYTIYRCCIYDHYFISHYSKTFLQSQIYSTKNTYPLAFSLTNRIIEATAAATSRPFKERTINILYSHRIKQPMREYVLEKIYSKYRNQLTVQNDSFHAPRDADGEDYQLWCQTGRRHNPDFYKLLANTKICDCVGGFFHPNGIYGQADNWKLWEALSSGCCVVAIDFDLFDITFQVQPKQLVHYINITGNELKDLETFNKIFNGEIDIEKIAKAGREWALENYNSEAVAKYVLEKISV